MRLLNTMMPALLSTVRRLTGRRPRASSTSMSIFIADEHRQLVARMDAGDFDFDPILEERMCAAWRLDPASVPYPSVLSRAYASGDAVAMNEKSLMEISYRLPYSRAYENTQKNKYEELVMASSRTGIMFDGAIVVDVGCGFGGLLDVVRRMYPSTRLCGVECASTAINFIAHHRAYIRGIVADLEGETKPFIDAVGRDHDIVLCTEVLEHLMHPDRAIKNLLALKPRRGLAITVPQGRVDSAAQHINFWSPESWRSFVQRHAPDWHSTFGLCRSPGSPGGADNLAILLPKLS